MSISSQVANRPFKFGANDRKEFIVQESEVALKAQNDANGNPIYIGRAKVGSATSDDRWQIQFLTWDANESVTDVEWPQDALSNPSSQYAFVWDDRATYTFS